MNNERRKEIAALEAELRAALEKVHRFKYSETHRFSAKSPNGTNHHPLTWSMLDHAETDLEAAIVWLARAKLTDRFGSTEYDMSRPITV